MGQHGSGYRWVWDNEGGHAWDEERHGISLEEDVTVANVTVSGSDCGLLQYCRCGADHANTVPDHDFHELV